MNGLSRRLEVREGIRDVAVVVVFAWLAFHLLRTHVAERYLVDSPSMEPTIHGSEADGDVLLVDKTAFWADRPQPGEVVVLERPSGDGPYLIKRLLAIGPGRVVLREGDVFVGRDGAAPKRLTKSVVDGGGRRQTAFRFRVDDPNGTAESLFYPSPAWSVSERGLLVEGQPIRRLVGAARRGLGVGRRDRHLPLHMSTLRAIDSSFLTVTGQRLPTRRTWPRDLGMELRVGLGDGCEGLHLIVELAEQRYAVDYRTDGSGRFFAAGRVRDRFEGPKLAPSEPHTLAFGYLDGRFFLVVDGEAAWEREEPVVFRAASVPRLPRGVARYANLLHVGSIEGDALITSYRAFHDVHYEPEDQPYDLDENDLFVAGDNAYDSSDSRDRRHEPFTTAHLVGRPVYILAPSTRRGRAR